MNKEELKDYILKLQLPNELEKLVLELIDNAPEVNQALLSAIADILDLQADFHERAADILDEEADAYEELASELSLLDEEEFKDRAEAIRQNQEQLLEDINKKVQELQGLNQNSQNPQ